VTNIEEDHLDFYAGGRSEIEAAFARFVDRSDQMIACGDDPGVRAALALAGRDDAATFGSSAKHNRAVVEIGRELPSGIEGSLATDGERVDLSVEMPGVHNLFNAAAAVLAAAAVGVGSIDAAGALRGFTGIHRRFERRGVAGGATFVDDYAHHPTELAATLAAARAVGARRLIAVFQPHRYSRTQRLWRALGESLRGADLVVVTDVYGAGEEPIPGVSGRLLVEALEAASPGTPVVYVARRSEIADFLAQEVRPGDLVLTLGAGDVTMVSDEAMSRLEERS
jgi:UDP-N-acetylmuramate--alanine ligase